MGSVLDEVIGPDVIAMLWPEAHTGTVMQPYSDEMELCTVLPACLPVVCRISCPIILTDNF